MKRRNLGFLFLVVLSCSKPPDAPKDEPKQDWIFQFPGTASLSSSDLDPDSHWRQNSCRVMSSFLEPSKTARMGMMACGDLRLRTQTAISCFSVIPGDEQQAIKGLYYFDVQI